MQLRKSPTTYLTPKTFLDPDLKTSHILSSRFFPGTTASTHLQGQYAWMSTTVCAPSPIKQPKIKAIPLTDCRVVSLSKPQGLMP
jgi:hypothetical protein